MIQIKSSNVPTEREPLFSIDGVEYTIAKEVPGSFALQSLDYAATHSEEAGIRWIMVKLLGQEAYDALKSCEGASQEDMKKIIAVCREKAFGPVEEQGKG